MGQKHTYRVVKRNFMDFDPTGALRTGLGKKKKNIKGERFQEDDRRINGKEFPLRCPLDKL